MTTLNTIIEEEKMEFELNVYCRTFVDKDTQIVLTNLLTTAMQRAYGVGRAEWLRSEIEKLEGMKTKSSCGCPPFKPQHDGYCWNEEFPGESRAHNQALTSIITRYKEELLELDEKEV